MERKLLVSSICCEHWFGFGDMWYRCCASLPAPAAGAQDKPAAVAWVLCCWVLLGPCSPGLTGYSENGFIQTSAVSVRGCGCWAPSGDAASPSPPLCRAFPLAAGGADRERFLPGLAGAVTSRHSGGQHTVTRQGPGPFLAGNDGADAPLSAELQLPG